MSKMEKRETQFRPTDTIAPLIKKTTELAFHDYKISLQEKIQDFCSFSNILPKRSM